MMDFVFQMMNFAVLELEAELMTETGRKIRK